jgi:hypothetical protein
MARASGPADVHADDVVLDGKGQSIDVRGHVRVDAPPFFLTADALKLSRSWRGLELVGDARLSFCACAGPPFSIAFSGAAVAPPADLFLKNPKLLLFGVPVFWLPYFWLRAPTRLGLLPPVVALRGADGLYLGGGVHLPVHGVFGGNAALGLRAGGYALGGYGISAEVTSARTNLRAGIDALRGATGVMLDAHGATARGAQGVAANWDLDALRGPRALASVTQLETAARRHDRAEAEVSLLHGVLFGAGVRALGTRGAGSALAFGPWAFAQNRGVWGRSTVFESSGDLITLSDPGSPLAQGETHRAQRPSALLRAAFGVTSVAHVGPIGVRAEGRALWALRAGGSRPISNLSADEGLGESKQAQPQQAAQNAAQITGGYRSQVMLGLPLARRYGASVRHKFEPEIGMLALQRFGDGIASFRNVLPSAREREGAFQVARAQASLAQAFTVLPVLGVRSALGNADLQSEVSLHLGWAKTLAEGAWAAESPAALRSAVALDASLLAVRAELTVVSLEKAAGLAYARLGRAAGLHIASYLAGRSELDVASARSLGPSDDLSAPLLDSRGVSAGAKVNIPLLRLLRVAGGLDLDATRVPATLLGARAMIEFKDTCECVALRLYGSHRLGRPLQTSRFPSIDVWLEIDLHPR